MSSSVGFWNDLSGVGSAMTCQVDQGGSQKRCTMGGDRVRDCITHLLSIKRLNVDDFHVSVAINI